MKVYYLLAAVHISREIISKIRAKLGRVITGDIVYDMESVGAHFNNLSQQIRK